MSQTSGPGATDRYKLYHYKVDKLLGRGGSGTVYRGIDQNTGQVVAIKLFHTNYFQNAAHVRDLGKSVARFKKFEHPNVMRVFDFLTGDEGECLIQEYIDGPSLSWYLDNRPWALDERLMICAQVCNGLQYIHDQGFLHHDIKPPNVLFTRKGLVKLSDYSLYRPGLLSTITGSALKDLITPMYVAPELIDKKKASPESDIYALGVTMYRMFAEKMPFHADSLALLYQCHQKVKPEHPSVANRRCPQALGDVIMKMLAKSPDDRFHDCDMIRVMLGEMSKSRI